MKLNYLTVEIEDAKFHFEEIPYHAYLTFAEQARKAPEDSRDEVQLVMERLLKVEGLEGYDGQPIDADGVKQFRIPFSLALRIKRGYWSEVNKVMGIGQEAEAKNGATPA
jgi:hypothetical protein